MQLLEDHIRREGKVAPGNVLRVDGFLNHQIDVVLLTKLAEEFHTRFSGEKVDKILTIEASGIAIGCLVAQQFGVPLVFAKKSRSSNLPADVYATAVHSYTHGNVNQVVVSREYLHSGERVLLIDDFLAHGEALAGLVSLVQQAGGTVVGIVNKSRATLEGAGIVIEKAFQDGGDRIRRQGIRVESLARIAAMSVEEGVTFTD